MLALSNSVVNRQFPYNAFNLIFYILLLVSTFFRTLIFSCFFCSLLALYLKRNGVYGLAEVFIRCKEKGYTRSFASMCRQIRKKGYRKPIIHKKSYCKYEHMEGKYPGDKVQIDIKYVPAECIRFPSYGNRYYQII